MHGQTVETLAQRILSGEIPEGRRLDMAALQTELGVSLDGAARGAEGARGQGPGRRPAEARHVRPARAPTGTCSTRDVLRWQFAARRPRRRRSSRDLAEVRAIVEPGRRRPGRRPPHRRGPRTALETALDAMARRRRADAVAADLAFHRALLAATHNELLDRMEVVIETGLAERDRLVHSAAGTATTRCPATAPCSRPSGPATRTPRSRPCAPC